jgi:hypothetical protein
MLKFLDCENNIWHSYVYEDNYERDGLLDGYDFC